VVRAGRLDRSIRTATRVAEALRRIEPELVPIPQFGNDFALCRIGGQLVPIHAQEMADVFRQVHLMLKQTVTIDPASIISPESQEKDRQIRKLIAVDAG